jgi:hypothetical protein
VVPTSSSAETTGERPEAGAVERWFIHHGLPHLIHDYRASTDVFTRALPFLVLVFMFNVLGAFSDRFTGWGQALVALLSAGIILAVAAGINVARHRRPFQMPDRVGTVELATFVVAPALPPLLFGTSPITAAAAIIVGNIVVLALVYVVVSFGLVPTTAWAIRQSFTHLSQVFTLMGRALPFVLVFSAFLFLNAELWQVAQDFTPLSFWVTCGLLVFVAAVFISLRIPREISQIAQFDSWDQVCALANRSSSPLPHYGAADLHGRCDPPLSRADRVNVALVVLFNLGLQILLVSLAIGAFYVAFGVFAVRADTIVNWTSLDQLGADDVLVDVTLLNTRLVLTVELLRVVGFLMSFSALQFAVAAVTDATYREEFFDDVTDDVRQALAVRAIYLEDLISR